MFTPTIQDILRERLQAVPDIIVGKNFRHDLFDLVAAHMPRGNLAIVDDVDTAAASGDALHRALKDHYDCTHITLPRGVKADDVALAEINARAQHADMLIAVGSGTINDLVKYASAQAQKPYLLFPTALSMNGYVSASASLTLKGHKQSLAAALPLAVFADMGVLCAAPSRLAQAGIGDSLARSTAQSDWLLSHHLLGTAYEPLVYDIMRDIEPMVFEQIRAIVMRDAEASTALLSLILLSGFGMTIAKSSTPASGGEHMIAHAYSSSCGLRSSSAGSMDSAPPAASRMTMLHGEEMAVTTLLASQRIETLLHTHPRLAPTEWPRGEMEHYFSEEQITGFKMSYGKKWEELNAHLPHGELPQTKWEAAQEAISQIHISPEHMARLIKEAGLPSEPEHIGWDASVLKDIIGLCHFTRDRFTWLDVE